MNESYKNARFEVIIHLLVWVLLFFLPYAFTVGAGRPWNELFVHFWMQLVLLAAIFYINYFLLISRWLFSGRKWLFFVINLVIIALFVWARHEIIALNMESLDIPRRPRDRPIVSMYYIDFLIYLIPVAFAIAIHSGKRLVKMEDLRKEAYSIKLQSELQHLKYQLQPHFFFNSLNNIYGLVDTEPEKAKQTVHSLSKLMRHLLQNSEAESIFLADEIDFLNKYITLMTLRQSKDTKVECHFPSGTENIKIAPLLFVPIVENAFKHGVAATRPSRLFFELRMTGDGLIFRSENYNFPKSPDDMSGSGIGIENLRKRLAILYGDDYSLSTGVQGDLYTVTLSLKNLSKQAPR